MIDVVLGNQFVHCCQVALVDLLVKATNEGFVCLREDVRTRVIVLPVPIYRLNDHASDDLGLLEPAPSVERGDVVVLADGRESLVTSRVEARSGRLEAPLEVGVTSEHSYRPQPS